MKATKQVDLLSKKLQDMEQEKSKSEVAIQILVSNLKKLLDETKKSAKRKGRQTRQNLRNTKRQLEAILLKA